MKFAQKLSSAMILLVAVSFSTGGFFLVWGNFNDALETAVVQNERWHLMQCYAIESEVLDLMARGESVTDTALCTKSESMAGFSSNGESDASARIRLLDAQAELYSALSGEMNEAAQSLSGLDDESYLLRRVGQSTYMLMSSSITAPEKTYTLQSVCDVTSVFAVRQSQLLRLWGVELLTLTLCAGAAWLLSNKLTAPLSMLSSTSAKIAAGDYRARTGVDTDDEFGTLGRSFDAMAGAVEHNVDELKESVQRRDDFMGAFSHELKTPMTSIIGYADTLRVMQCEPETQKMAAGYIFTEAKRVETLSGKLLELMSLHDEELALTPVPLTRVLREMQAALAPVKGAVRILCEGEKDVTVMADKDLLCDLLYNLVHNAIKANPKDLAVRVHVAPAQRPGAVIVSVSDTGCGIPKAELLRVIEPFYMVDKSRAREQGGSGIGLSLAQRIAAAHGTVLVFESKEGVGITVSFTLQTVRAKETNE